MPSSKSARRKKPNGIVMRMWNEQSGLCCYCEKPMLWATHQNQSSRLVASREHLKRTADGGTNDTGNIRLAHHCCNSNRGERSWLEWKSICMGEI